MHLFILHRSVVVNCHDVIYYLLQMHSKPRKMNPWNQLLLKDLFLSFIKNKNINEIFLIGLHLLHFNLLSQVQCRTQAKASHGTEEERSRQESTIISKTNLFLTARQGHELSNSVCEPSGFFLLLRKSINHPLICPLSVLTISVRHG